jgi:hypothetical protein
MRKFFTLFAIVIVVIVAGFYALNNYIYNQKQGDEKSVEPYRGTLTGEYTCLPHRNTNGPQTLECALGLKTETGDYYALDFEQNPQIVNDLQTGDKFKANGMITPIEYLNSDHWQRYKVEGIFSITDGFEKL